MPKSKEEKITAHRKADKKYRDAHKEEELARGRKWRKENPERQRKTQNARYAASPEKGRARSQKWRDAHPGKEAESMRNWRKENPERELDNHLKRNYGITIDDYNEMFQEQGGRCAICGKHQSEFKNRLYVDHNHSTGTVRGLLCQKCNTAIGLLSDDIILVRMAAEYLENGNIDNGS
jgi:hypothetical protein